MGNTGLGARLRAARERLYMSQATLAELIGAGNQSTVAGWERGRTEPDGETLARLAVILKVSTDHLLGVDAGVLALPADVTDLAIDIASLPPAERAVLEKIVAALKAEDKDKVVPG